MLHRWVRAHVRRFHSLSKQWSCEWQFSRSAVFSFSLCAHSPYVHPCNMQTPYQKGLTVISQLLLWCLKNNLHSKQTLYVQVQRKQTSKQLNHLLLIELHGRFFGFHFTSSFTRLLLMNPTNIPVTTLGCIHKCYKFSINNHLRRARLVLRWATVFGFNSRCRTLISVFSQPATQGQLFYPSRVGKWVPALAGKANGGMVHSVSGWMRGVQLKLWDPLRLIDWVRLNIPPNTL